MTQNSALTDPAPPLPGRLLTPQFLLLLLTTAVFGLSFSAFFLLPKFLAVELSADAATIGGVSAVSMLSSVVFMPLVGVQVDRRGRKVFGCLGTFLFALSCAGFLLVDNVGPLLWLLRVVQGGAFTLFYISLSTMATDISPTERLGQAIGLFGAVMISTNAIGPALAEWTAENYGWVTVFKGSFAAASVSAVLTLFIRERRQARSPDHSTSMLHVMRRPGLRRILAVAVLVGVTLGALFTFYQPWALLRGFEQVSSYLIAFAASAMFVRVALGGLADRLGRLRVATVAAFFYVAAPISLIGVDFLGLWFTGGLLGLSHGLFFPALNAVAVGLALDSERGKAMAAYHGSFNIGFAAGSYLLGHLAIATNYPTIFAVAGVSCLAGFLVLVTTANA